MNKSIIWLGIVCVLGACGSSGGSSFPVLPPAGSENGFAATADASVTPTGNVVADTFGPVTESALATTASGALTSNGQLVASNQIEVKRLEHSTYGAWIQPNGNNPRVAVASFGDVTPATSLPSADAVYRGRSLGIVQDNARNETDSTSSAMTIAVSNGYSDVAIDSRGTLFFDVNDTRNNGVDNAYDFAGTGKVTGSGFTATISNQVAGFDLTGTADGKFYGPAAQEVGGVFRMTGTGESTYSGSFGATR